jgi:septal ring factor EnvC (AmiA/AmiB activator)
MKVLFFMLPLFVSCAARLDVPYEHGATIAKNLSPRRQRQKISALEKKLEAAEKEQQKIQEEVEQLRREMHTAQLNLIQRQIDDFMREMEKYRNSPEALLSKLPHDATALFVSERELLYKMIQNGPSPSSFEAQVILDRILEMITQLSNETTGPNTARSAP